MLLLGLEVEGGARVLISKVSPGPQSGHDGGHGKVSPLLQGRLRLLRGLEYGDLGYRCEPLPDRILRGKFYFLRTVYAQPPKKHLFLLGDVLAHVA